MRNKITSVRYKNPMHSVRENNFRKKDYVLLSSCLKKTNAARQKSVQIRRAHLTLSKSESKKRKKMNPCYLCNLWEKKTFEGE